MSKDPNRYREYDKEYQARPEEVAKRVARNKARRELMREGVVKKGDGKDVDHIKKLEDGGSTSRGNLRAVSASTNRGRNQHKK